MTHTRKVKVSNLPEPARSVSAAQNPAAISYRGHALQIADMIRATGPTTNAALNELGLCIKRLVSA